MKKYEYMSELQLPWEKMKEADILLTGGNGLIMSSLTDALMAVNKKRSLNMNIHVLCRNAAKAEERFCAYIGDDNFHLIIQDVSEKLQSDVKFRYVIHGASSAHPGAFNTTPVDVMKANFLGTLNLLEYSANCPGIRFMFVSSSEVYGENEEGIDIFTEDISGVVDYTRFRSCYPESKRASETLCMSFKKQYDTDVVVVRPAYIYGHDVLESNNRADVYFLKQVLKHEDIVMYSEGSQIRSYCYVDDCITGMLYALLLGESGEVYNIGDMDCIVTLKEYAQALADAAGVALRYEPQTAPSGTAFLHTTRCILDTTKLKKLGWNVRFSLEEGIRDILLQENSKSRKSR